MDECDICHRNRVAREVIVNDGQGNLIVLSLCGQEDCQSQMVFEPVSNYISLDNASDDGVE